MDSQQKERMRSLLMQYPGANENTVEEQLATYEGREKFKKDLISERGFSNTLAERFLDKQGWSRPPGWHSVFFYPGSSRPRNNVIFWLTVIGIAAWFLLNES